MNRRLRFMDRGPSYRHHPIIQKISLRIRHMSIITRPTNFENYFLRSSTFFKNYFCLMVELFSPNNRITRTANETAWSFRPWDRFGPRVPDHDFSKDLRFLSKIITDHLAIEDPMISLFSNGLKLLLSSRLKKWLWSECEVDKWYSAIYCKTSVILIAEK